MNSKPRNHHRIVIVTGASSGIGRATAVAFARDGATVVLVSRSLRNLERVAEEIRRFNPKVAAIAADVSSQQQVEAMVAAVEREFGRIDVLVNNAGTSAVGPVAGTSFVADAERLLATSFFGKVFAVRAVLSAMRRQGQGHIVNLSSVAGRKALPDFGAYSATLHAVTGFSDSLRQELHGSGIGVTTVLPSLAQTALFDGVAPDRLPALFRQMKSVSADAVANAIVRAVYRQQPWVVVPWQPRWLLWADALSVRLGDWFVRQLSRPPLLRLLGLYRGRHEAAETGKPV